MNTAVPLKTLKAQPLRLPENRDAFYGGKWHKSKSERYADTINPSTGELLGPVADCGAADVDAAVSCSESRIRELAQYSASRTGATLEADCRTYCAKTPRNWR